MNLLAMFEYSSIGILQCNLKILKELVSTIDFRYINEVISKEEAIQLLKTKRAGTEKRVKYLLENGYPAYTTQVGKLPEIILCGPRSVM